MRKGCICVACFAEAEGCNTDLGGGVAGGECNGRFELQRCYFGVASHQVKWLVLASAYCFCAELVTCIDVFLRVFVATLSGLADVLGWVGGGGCAE